MKNQTPRHWVWYVVIAVVMAIWEVSAAEPPLSDEAQARKNLNGAWRGFAVEGKGEKPDQGPVKLEITISDETIQGIEIKGAESIDHGEGVYVLDLKASPRHLDGTKTNPRGRKETWIGIYKLEQNTLYWCVARRERPKTFETVKGQFLMILKRGNL
jgi:uncharacterized protein (TIGR03067 family)